MEFFKKGREDAKEIFTRITKKDFSGNTGQAIKNGSYQFFFNIVAEFAGLVLTIFLARLLLPDLFGLYNLALSVILIFFSLSDLGIGTVIIKFVSEKAGNLNLARACFKYLSKLKFIILFVLIIALLISANYISTSFFNKPIFLALMAGALYLLFSGILSLLQPLLQSFNDFRKVFFSEVVYESSRIILVPLAVLLSLKYALPGNVTIMFIILAIAAAYFLASAFIFFSGIKRIKFLEKDKIKLPQKQKSVINKFLLATSATAFSGLFFSYIDRILLGHFVASNYLGYYVAALGLLSAVSSIIVFSSALLPVFSRLDEEKARIGLKKSIRGTLLLSLLAFIGTLALSSVVIYIVYGPDYNVSVNILRILSPLVIIMPLIGIYSAYFNSRGKPQIISYLIFGSTAMNILLNYIFITSLLKYGQLFAVYGSGAATLISQFLYLLGLLIFSKRDRKMKENNLNTNEKKKL